MDFHFLPSSEDVLSISASLRIGTKAISVTAVDIFSRVVERKATVFTTVMKFKQGALIFNDGRDDLDCYGPVSDLEGLADAL